MQLRTILVLVAGLNSASVAAADTGGGWIVAASGLPERGQWRNGFDLADFNGDRRLDLAHGPPRRSQGDPAIFLAGPGSEFSRCAEASFPEVPFDYGDAAAADFDGDGHADLALGVHHRGLVVLSGDGRGGFKVQTNYLAAEPGKPVFSSRALVSGDVDGDGRPDLVALGEGPSFRGGGAGGAYGLRVLLNRLPEPWDWRELQPSTGRLFGDDVILGDFDGDGQVDLATASNVQSQRGVVFWGDGKGEFVPGELAAARPRSFIEALAAADFDGDGDDDLAIAFSDLQGATERTGVDVLVSSGNRTFQGRTLPWGEQSGRPTAVAAGDWDGDGDPDLVALTATGALVSFENDGGRLRPGPGLPFDQGGRLCRGFHVMLADLDGDGRDEAVAAFADERCTGGGSLRVWKWQGVRP